ncbi:MAG TPA: 30S ribosomal protein S9 [Bacteroidales bacterium]|nr:30S ribosomal protein S9 [Bacteroidales bacterium]
MDTINTIGRRKASVARIYLSSGKGNVTINKRKLEDYFPLKQHQDIALKPLQLTETMGTFDIKANLNGGGLAGQADAMRLAIARALVKADPEHHANLKPDSMLTRDPRVVERKKPGQKKARKKYQFSKR